MVAAGLTLSGCCLGSGRYIQPSPLTLTSWDGRTPLPKPKHAKPANVRKTSKAVAPDDDSLHETELGALKPYSNEWWSVRDAIDRAAEVKLAKKMIICRGCMPREPEDQTGSIAPR